MHTRFALERAQDAQRLLRLPLLELALGSEREPRDRKALGLRLGPAEKLLRGGVLAHVDRRPRADERGESRCPGKCQRLVRPLLCLDVATFEERDHRGVLPGTRSRFALPTPPCANLSRQPRRMHDHP